jgi:hypothetical protein
MSLASLKKLGVVATILLLAWVIYVFRQVPHEKTPFAKATDKTEEIILSQGNRAITLRKDSGQWKVGQEGTPFYASDAEMIKPLLSSLGTLRIEDEITDRADRQADYDVTVDTGIRVRLLDAKQTNLAEGIFGKQAPDFAHIYFRYTDKPNVYLARGLIRGDLGRIEPNYWRSRQLIDMPEAKVEGILIETKSFKTDLVRTGTDTWTMNGEPAEVGYVNAQIGTLSHSHLDEFIDPSLYPNLTFEGLTYAHVLVKGTDTSIDLRIGAQDPKTKRYPASIGKEQGLVWLSEGTISSLLKKASDLKTKPNPKLKK